MVTFMGVMPSKGPTSRKVRQGPSYQERVEELKEAGLSVPVLAKSIGVSQSSVTNWLNGTTSKPNIASRDRIDNIARVLHRVAEAGTDPEYAAAWMQTPVDEEKFPYSPMDIIGEKPEVALKVVHMFFERPLQ
jgi:transcriptional regulator with XRE-family HTH domain